MPPKKKENKAKVAGEEVEGEDPAILLSNYQKFSKSIGLPVHTGIVKALNDEEKYPIDQLIVDEEYGIIGPGGTRALMTAILGSGPGMKGGPYKLLKSLRIWKSNIGDDGTAAIAEVLRQGGAEVKIGFLELLDDKIGPRGALALGTSLSQSNNLSLLTLKLDYNSMLGLEGTVNLCKGLRTNATLKQLHLSFCQLPPEAGVPLSEVIANTRSSLEVLGLTGNRLGGKGLSGICKGLIVNTKLKTLYLADNMIDQMEEDVEGLSDFRDCLMTPGVALTTVDLLYNRIGEKGAEVLVPALTEANKTIEEFLVDLTLPMNLFELIFRRSGGGKKGGKKKGKGKKKK
mmetsp:Transcript_6195/g.6363  ORF Transcript_6195/g.6363 Transcript_6195/m.6363 type:complete len:344 (+) Transcript_6195:173-1204(+)|eukprot:CAMPEP_0119044218 /NCGR_PEP_ID=MMETSP1177-20130426/29603_1 /TAXON_ID=2985 /ORGANISM="Ochromonas sp, Strain CCMP1899" /LENGTH=343 /DNA_ID=CAMNT_0007013945 /DNA_START=114 /DNA_END=1145 /DNA_ORIENTATION=+